MTKQKNDQKLKGNPRRRTVLIGSLLVLLVGVGLVAGLSLTPREPVYHIAYNQYGDIVIMSLPDMQKNELAANRTLANGVNVYDWPEGNLKIYRVGFTLLPAPWNDEIRKALIMAIPEDAFTAAIAPDGDTLIYGIRTRHDDENTRTYTLLSHQDGEISQRTYDPLPTGSPTLSWSPDGKTLTFSFSTRDEPVNRLAFMEIDTGNFTPITDASYINRDPTYSADGTHLIYTSFQTGYARPTIMNLETGETHIITEASFAYVASLSPDAEKAIMMSNHESSTTNVYVVDKDGSNLLRLTDFEHYVDAYPIWLEVQ